MLRSGISWPSKKYRIICFVFFCSLLRQSCFYWIWSDFFSSVHFSYISLMRIYGKSHSRIAQEEASILINHKSAVLEANMSWFWRLFNVSHVEASKFWGRLMFFDLKNISQNHRIKVSNELCNEAFKLWGWRLSIEQRNSSNLCEIVLKDLSVACPPAVWRRQKVQIQLFSWKFQMLTTLELHNLVQIPNGMFPRVTEKSTSSDRFANTKSSRYLTFENEFEIAKWILNQQCSEMELFFFRYNISQVENNKFQFPDNLLPRYCINKLDSSKIDEVVEFTASATTDFRCLRNSCFTLSMQHWKLELNHHFAAARSTSPPSHASPTRLFELKYTNDSWLFGWNFRYFTNEKNL